MNFLVALQTVGILLAMAVPGFIIVKAKLIKANDAIKVLSVVLLYVCQPFITVNAFLNTAFDSRILVNLIFIVLITSVLMVILLYLAYFTFQKDRGAQRRDVYSFASSFGNVGYMAIPFLQILTNNNSEIILYATASLVGFNFVGWTLGCFFISRNKKHISLKHAILNLPTLSFLIVLPLFIFNLNFIRFPSLQPLANASSLFANMMAPISMTILGMQFSKIKFKELFNDYRLYITAAIKLIVSPLIAVGLLLLCNLFVDLSDIKLNIVVLAAMPSATLVMMFSAIYDSDTASAAKSVLMTTVFSVITIPLAILLLL
jgi:predicted permease